MSLDLSGQNARITSSYIQIHVPNDHPLIKLGNALPWAILVALVVEDLKATTAKGFWWLGRKIKIREHLAAYFLQKLYDLTDRETEYGIKDNAAYQLFCGLGIVDGWHTLDHTKIEKFRSRLTPETQRILANELAKVAITLGFGDPSETDIDSTVQEANIAYPSDASLMTKLAGLAKKVIDYLAKKTRGFLPKGLDIDIKAVKKKAREYFFLPKNTTIEKRRDVFKELHRFIKQQMRPIINTTSTMDAQRLSRLPWNIRRALKQIAEDGWRYLLDVGHFTRRHTIKAGKILSFHAKQVACIKKGKVGKDKEFGRVFQLGRIKGNFLFVLASTSLRMDDKSSLIPMIEEHANIFGEGTLKSVSTDKGYWSAKNHKALVKQGVKEVGLQRPGKIKDEQAKDLSDKLRDRRAGIEPLIGHTKQGGQLGRSRMKSDAATSAAAYGSVAGFNLRQLIRHQAGKMKRNAA